VDTTRLADYRLLAEGSLGFNLTEQLLFTVNYIFDNSTAVAVDGLRYFFAHGVCGNPLPGDTEVSVTIEDVTVSEYGEREFAAVIHTQPTDYDLESARHILSEAGTGNTAKINFNVVDHELGHYGYPILYNVEVSDCTNACTGSVATAGVACDQRGSKMRVHADNLNILGGILYVGPVQTCTCYDGANFVKGACTCPSNTQPFDAMNACIPAPVVSGVSPAATTVVPACFGRGEATSR